ncbi:MAG: NAD(P)/FAD-dependent oxidoreductase [Clostridia bacterium]|nr:NAD(P)/FAD-dependent oxidoreductase [Clostridia bacterium]
MERYDIAVIGAGPAGVSAAITATIRNKSVVLIGSPKISDKVRKAHRIDNYPGLPAATGEQFADALKAHLDSLNIGITEKRVSAVYAMGSFFSLQADEDMIEANAVILATGVTAGKPLPGEDKFLGRGVSYCATCDARLYAGRPVAVIGYNAESVKEAEFLSEIVSEVEYFPMTGSAPEERGNLKVIREIPRGITGGLKASAVATDAGEHPCDCVFVLRDAVAPDKLVPGLKTEGAHVVVDISMKTNLPGLFACGDIAGKPYQYIKAAGQGNIAALSAVEYLDNNKKG